MVPMDAKPTRPWYRLHWGTWAVTLTVAGALVWSQLSPSLVLFGGSGGHSDSLYWNGWPYPWLTRNVHEIYSVSQFRGIPILVTTTTHYQWRPRPLILSIALTLALVASVAAMLDRWRRAWSGKRQLTLGSLLTLTFVAGALILVHDRSLLGVGRLAWFLEAVVLFALGCALFLLASAIPRAGVRLLARLRRDSAQAVRVERTPRTR